MASNIVKFLGLHDFDSSQNGHHSSLTSTGTLKIEDGLVRWSPKLPDLWMLISSHLLRPYLVAVIKRFPILGATLTWVTSIIYYCVKHFRRPRNKLLRWLMSHTMARITVPSSDTNLDRKFKVMLAKKLEDGPTISGLPYSHKCCLAIFQKLFSSSGRNLVARTKQDRVGNESHVEYVVPAESWQLITHDNKVFIVTTTTADDAKEKPQQQPQPGRPNHGDDCECSACYNWENEEYERKRDRRQDEEDEQQQSQGPDSEWGHEVWCLGDSATPIQELLNTIGQSEAEKKKVEVRKFQFGAWGAYEYIEPRSMDSIYLDKVQKYELLDDVAEYVDPDTEQWYKDRSIPYRRGYLLCGRPGCGKTSFAQALAARHKLRLSVLSLSARDLDDVTLSNLFSEVGRGDIILVEDIDQAGCNVNRDAKAEANPDEDLLSDSESDSDDSDDETNPDAATDSRESSVSGHLKGEGRAGSSADCPVAQYDTKRGRGRTRKSDSEKGREEQPRKLTKAAKKAEELKRLAEEEKRRIEKEKRKEQKRREKQIRHQEKEKKRKAAEEERARREAEGPKVTLAGLLNAIDGVSSPQGHILLLTTNKKDDLDEALIRAGRIDFHAEFSFASAEQAEQLFEYMYKKPSAKQQAKYDEKIIKELAKQFAQNIPAGALSCAQLQSYVLQYRTKPQDAVDKVAVWAKDVAAGNVKVSENKTELVQKSKPSTGTW